MVKIYGKRHSRALRCLWVLEEMGLAYEQFPLNTQNGETKTPEHLARHPSGKVPVIVDDGFVLRESIAIALYLVTKAETPLWSNNAQTQALIYQWSSWAVSEMEFPLNSMFIEKRRLSASGATPDEGFMTVHAESARRALKLLDVELAGKSYILGDTFTLADLTAYASAMMAPNFIDLAPYPAVREWMARCSARPAWKRVEALP